MFLTSHLTLIGHFIPCPLNTDSLFPLSVHLCEFCSTFFDDARGLHKHIASGCNSDPSSSSFNVSVSAGEDADHLGDAIGDVDDAIGDAADDAIDDANVDPIIGINEDLRLEGKLRKGDDHRTGPRSESPCVVSEESEIKTKAKRAGKKLNDKGGGGSKGGIVVSGGGGKKRGRKPKAKPREKPSDAVAQTDEKTGFADLSIPTAGVQDAGLGGGDVDENLRCRICGETFTEKAKLHKHIWKHNRKRSHIW